MPVPSAQKLDDLAWTALLLGLVWLVNRYSDVEIAARRADRLRCWPLRFWRDERPDGARPAQATLRATRPMWR